jgi:hypothetical protein
MPEFDESMLPPRPQLIPDDLRSLSVDNTGSDWSKRVPPAAVGMFVAAVTQWLSHPRFGVAVQVDTDAGGWTIRVGLPEPETREDVVLPE